MGEKTFMIVPSYGLKGVPIFLDGVLTENFTAGFIPPMTAPYFSKGLQGRLSPLPRNLVLEIKNPSLKCSCYPSFGGFLVTGSFLAVLEQFKTPSYDLSKLETIGWKGKQVTTSQYYFIDFPYAQQSHNIDYDQSCFALEENATVPESVSPSQKTIADFEPNILGFKTLHLKEVPFDVYQLYSHVAYKYLVCNEAFMTELLKTKPYGIKFVELPYLGNLFENSWKYESDVIWKNL